MNKPATRPRITAVLGPTNTGKTYFAIERMLAHESGMIGFPLRLLARENYDRVVALRGAGAVALVTGEEKIVPPSPDYFLCTVESMPVDRPVAFLAIDEIQLAGDRERGHVFTDRLLRARGTGETMFLGADTARRLIRRLVPDAAIVGRPRLSTLTHIGAKRLTRLPRRSAVVAFSATDVYGLAEQMRRRRGGVAVVLGALSPRTRNAQVAMFEAGEVDYMVATDAIGMGLNMDINHVGFAGLVKFDGHAPRRLGAAEIGQIAGRAGRHMRDGTFGMTNGAPAFDDETVIAVENHVYEPIKGFYWRNADLHFSSVMALRRSLEAPPRLDGLRPAPMADDGQALALLAERPEVLERANGPDRVRLLWEVCQVPDFRKLLTDAHVGFLGRLFRHLVDDGVLPTDWVAAQLAALDRVDGEIETLTQRISFIRTWTYISHRPGWTEDPGHWQERARGIEDRLSDALHARLTQRFVDRRAAVLARGLAGAGGLGAIVTAEDEVLVEGERVGRLSGFRFVPDPDARGDDARAIRAAACQVLRPTIGRRVTMCTRAGDRAFSWGDGTRLIWRRAPVAQIVRGSDVLSPTVDVLASELLDPAARDLVRDRLAAWVETRITRELAPLLRVRAALPELAGPARGIAFQLTEALGVIPRAAVDALVASLSAADRKRLTALGVRLGHHAVFLSACAKPGGRALRCRLLHAYGGEPVTPLDAAVRAIARPSIPDAVAWAQGFVAVGTTLVRVDALEKLSVDLRRRSRQGAFLATPNLAARIGADDELFGAVLIGLGYRPKRDGDHVSYRAPAPKRSARGRSKPRPRSRPRSDDSPFAKLRALKGRA